VDIHVDRPSASVKKFDQQGFPDKAIAHKKLPRFLV
jgi:hypothetical protein